MLRNYLKTTLRNLIKNKLYSIINISGLAVGMATSILVLLYVQYELNYDKCFANYDRMYRLIRDYSIGGEDNTNSSTSYGLAPTSMERFPSIDKATRYFNRVNVVKYNDKVFNERILFTDSLYFEIFNYEFISGDPRTALKNPNEIIINESIAAKYFSNENPIGKILIFNDKTSFTVSAVVKDPPPNSHFQYDIFASIVYFKNRGIPEDDWYDNYFNTIVLLEKNSAIQDVESQLTALYAEKMDDGRDTKIHLETLSDLHFSQGKGKSDRSGIYLFTAIGVFILIIACINYMNLSTSRYIQRTKEVGLRKVLGSSKRQLIFQFYGESILVALISSFFGIILVETALPFFNHMTTSHLDIDYLSIDFVTIIVSVIIISSLLAGSYPALFLSSFKTISILKNDIGSAKGSNYFRKILVIIQFSITTILLISTGTVYYQFKYMINKDVGIGVENVIFLDLNHQILNNYDAFKNTLMTCPDISSMCRSSNIPTYTMSLLNNVGWDGSTQDERTAFAFTSIDFDFFETIQIDLLSGRYISDEFVTDSVSVVINKKAEALMTDGSAIGMHFDLETPIEVVGVVENFHSLPLTYSMEPMMFFIWDEFYNYVLINLEGNQQNALQFIEEQWKVFAPGFPFYYEYIEDFNKRQYGDTERTAIAFSFFVIIAIIISCAGLYGLSAFIAEQRTKEIGIRKAMGASSKIILILLNKSFTKWVIISFIIGSPIAYFAMQQWQKNFAYFEKINISVYLLTLLAISLIAQLTISYQTLKTARANPVKSLRYE